MYIAIIIQKELVMVYYNYAYIIAIPMHNNMYARKVIVLRDGAFVIVLTI